MSSTNSLDYFYAPTRIRSDEYSEAQQNIGSTSALTRQTTAIGSGCSDTLNPAAAMADQPGFIATGGFGGLGCKVDESTDLKWGIPGAWRQKGKHELWARPFATTPNLGGGDQSKVNDESYLIHSALIKNRKEANTIMDSTFPGFFAPLLDLQATEFKNPHNWVQEWTWGGDSTRLVQTKRTEVKN
jgi:hypothetical protein